MFRFNGRDYKLNYLASFYAGIDILIENDLTLDEFVNKNIRILGVKKDYLIYLDNERYYIDHQTFLSILLDISKVCPSFAYEPDIKKCSLEKLKKISKFTSYKYNKYEDPSDISQPSINDLELLSKIYDKSPEEFNVYMKSNLPDYVKYTAMNYLFHSSLCFTSDLNMFLQTIYFNRSENSQLALNYETFTKIYFDYPDLKIFVEELAADFNEYVMIILNEYLYNADEKIFIGLNNALSNIKVYKQKLAFLNILQNNGIYYQYVVNSDDSKDRLALVNKEIENIKYVKSGRLINFNTKTVRSCEFYQYKNEIIKRVNSYKLTDYQLKLEIKRISLSSLFVNDIKNYIYLYSKNNSIKYSFKIPDAILNDSTIEIKHTDVAAKFKEKYNIGKEVSNFLKIMPNINLSYTDIFNNFNVYSAEAVLKYKNPFLLRLSYDMNLHLLNDDILDILNIYINKYNIISVLKYKSLLYKCKTKDDILKLIYGN